MKRLASGAVDYSDPMVRDGGGQVTLRIFKCLKPVIAAVNGPAVGIGVTMQLAMDIRIASEAARFGFVFSQRGIVPEAASSWFLPRIVGISQALEWCYSGRVFPAQEALAGRLVSKVVPPDDLLPTARALAKEFAAKTAPVSVALIRQMMWRMMGADDPMEAHKVDSRGIYARGRSEDVKEGVVSFLEKRPAEFKNKVSQTCPTISRGGRSASISERPARIGQRDARRRRPAARHQQDGAIVSKDAAGAGSRRLRHAQSGLCEPPEGAGSAGGGHPSRHRIVCRRPDGSVHFVCHSMGGLAGAGLLARYRPKHLGRVVMLGTPNSGSEIADRLKNFGAYRAFFGPAGQQLGTQRSAVDHALFPPVDYPVGIIAGNRSIDPVAGTMLPKPHDGRVSVANTKLDGMADHVVVAASHPWLVRNISCDRADDCVFAGWEVQTLRPSSPAKAGDPVFQRRSSD